MLVHHFPSFFSDLMDSAVPSDRKCLGGLEGVLSLLRQWPWIHRDINRGVSVKIHYGDFP